MLYHHLLYLYLLHFEQDEEEQEKRDFRHDRFKGHQYRSVRVSSWLLSLHGAEEEQGQCQLEKQSQKIEVENDTQVTLYLLVIIPQQRRLSHEVDQEHHQVQIELQLRRQRVPALIRSAVGAGIRVGAVVGAAAVCCLCHFQKYRCHYYGFH